MLLSEEVAPGDIFEPMHSWLDDNIDRFGFFRPYKFYQGGIFPEPWHLSFASLSLGAIKLVNVQLLESVIKDVNILGKEIVLSMLPEIYQRHIFNIVAPDEQNCFEIDNN